MDKVITVVEAQEESEVVAYYQKFIMTNLSGGSSEKIKVTKKMGYVISVETPLERILREYLIKMNINYSKLILKRSDRVIVHLIQALVKRLILWYTKTNKRGNINATQKVLELGKDPNITLTIKNFYTQ